MQDDRRKLAMLCVCKYSLRLVLVQFVSENCAALFLPETRSLVTRRSAMPNLVLGQTLTNVLQCHAQPSASNIFPMLRALVSYLHQKSSSPPVTLPSSPTSPTRSSTAARTSQRTRWQEWGLTRTKSYPQWSQVPGVRTTICEEWGPAACP